MIERSERISRLKKSRAARAAYIKGKLNVLIPAQIRALRLKSETPRQEDLAQQAGMLQSRISAIETPGAVNFNLETLVRIASTLKVGLVVKFVPFSEMLRWENGFNQDRFDVVTLENDAEFIRPAARLNTHYEMKLTGWMPERVTAYYFLGLGASLRGQQVAQRSFREFSESWSLVGSLERLWVQPTVAPFSRALSTGPTIPIHSIRTLIAQQEAPKPPQVPVSQREDPAA